MGKNKLVNEKPSIVIPVKGDPLEAFLKKEYGIDNVLLYEFDDLSNNDGSNFNFSHVRGSVQLQKGKIRTVKETEERFYRVLTHLRKYKPL